MPKRVDANQKEIVDCFRKLGATVAVTSAVGNGFPDVVVGFKGKNYLIEIKDGSKIPSQQKLTSKEKEFHESWFGIVHIIRSVNEAISLIAHANNWNISSLIKK